MGPRGLGVVPPASLPGELKLPIGAMPGCWATWVCACVCEHVCVCVTVCGHRGHELQGNACVCRNIHLCAQARSHTGGWSHACAPGSLPSIPAGLMPGLGCFSSAPCDGTPGAGLSIIKPGWSRARAGQRGMSRPEQSLPVPVALMGPWKAVGPMARWGGAAGGEGVCQPSAGVGISPACKASPN